MLQMVINMEEEAAVEEVAIKIVEDTVIKEVGAINLSNKEPSILSLMNQVLLLSHLQLKLPKIKSLQTLL